MSRSGEGAVVVSMDKGANHDNLMPLLTAMFREFQDAAKKKPDSVLNQRKVEIVNRLLVDVFKILDGEPTRAYVDLLDENDLPQNSDVVLILGQTVAAMEAFHAKYYVWDGLASAREWKIPDEKSRGRKT
jgi:hypothetical protein